MKNDDHHEKLQKKTSDISPVFPSSGIIPLNRETPDQYLSLIGGKGQGLIRLIRGGAHVPESLCIIPEADSREAIRNALDYFSDTEAVELYAVRSSADIEDGTDKSFAGQFETYLRISGVDNLIESVEKCRSSWKRAGAYAGITERIRISVIIQKMIEADTAGVLFTCEPVSCSCNHIVVEMVKGTAEYLVGGTVTAERFTLDRNGNWAETVKSNLLPPSILQTLVNEALKLQEFIEADVKTDNGDSSTGQFPASTLKPIAGPLDFEWALKDNTVHWLQVRPVTTMNSRKDAFNGEINFIRYDEWPNIEPDDTVLSSMNAREAIPWCIPPLMQDHLLGLVTNGFLATFRFLGVPDEKIRDIEGVAVRDGRVYLNVTQLRDIIRALPIKNPDAIGAKFLGGDSAEQPQLKFSPELFKIAFRFIRGELTLKNEYRQFVEAEIKNWRYPESAYLAGLSGKELLDAGDGLDEFAETFRLHILGSFGYMNTYATIEKICKKYETEPSAMIQGLGTLRFASAAETLRELAWTLKDNVHLIFDENYTLLNNWKDTIRNSPELQTFRLKFEEYLDEYGHLGEGSLNYLMKTWREEPDKVLKLVGEIFRTNEVVSRDEYLRILSARREKAIAEAKAKMSPLDKILFSIGIKMMHDKAPFRENLKFYAHRRSAIVKTYVFEAADRLVDGGIIDTREDILFLKKKEVSCALTGQADTNLKEIVTRRKSEFTNQQKRPWPLHRVEGAKGTRFYFGIPPGEGHTYKGIPASAGKVTGKARVILSLDEADKLQLGEILVTTTTDPCWTPYFSLAGGVVVEIGSMLSHGAVVAREIGIPAVLGIPGIVAAIRDGDCLAIDGAEGIVEIRREKN